MSYQCQFCAETRIFDSWRGLIGHINKNHPGQRPDRELSEVREERATVDDLPDEQEQSIAEAMQETPSEPIRERKERSPDAQKLLSVLTVHGVPEAKAERLVEGYTLIDEYRTAPGLLSYLKSQLSAAESAAIVPCIKSLFPSQAVGLEGLNVKSPEQELREMTSRMFDLAMGRFEAPKQASSSDPLTAVLLQHLLSDKDKRNDENNERYQRMLEERDARIAKLEATLEDRKMQLPQPDFENQLLTMADERVIPFLATEAKAFRQDAKEVMREVFSNVAPNIREQMAKKPGVLTEDESRRLAEAMTIRLEMQELARKAGKYPFGQPQPLYTPQVPTNSPTGVSYD